MLGTGMLIGVVLLLSIILALDSRPTTIVDSQIIVDRISKQEFLVTSSVYQDQKVTQTVDQGSAWSNFWWGQEINADALLKVDVGVDLKGITTDDVNVNNRKNEICINLPEATIQDTSLVGDINVESKNGVLKEILDSDENRDFNLALEQLRTDAENGINESILADARQSAVAIISNLIAGGEYEVKITPDCNL